MNTVNLLRHIYNLGIKAVLDIKKWLWPCKVTLKSASMGNLLQETAIQSDRQTS